MMSLEKYSSFGPKAHVVVKEELVTELEVAPLLRQSLPHKDVVNLILSYFPDSFFDIDVEEINRITSFLKQLLFNGKRSIYNNELNFFLIWIASKLNIEDKRTLSKEIETQGERSSKWQDIVYFLSQLNKKTQRLIKENYRLEYITGTRSPTLIGIVQVARSAFLNHQYALVPSGILIDHNIMPLTGELGRGLLRSNGVNRGGLSVASKLSGMYVAHEYANNLMNVFSVKYETEYVLSQRHDLLRLKIAVCRLIQYGRLSFEELKKLETHLCLVMKPYLQPLANEFPSWKRYTSLYRTPFTIAGQKPQGALLPGTPVGFLSLAHEVRWGFIAGYNAVNRLRPYSVIFGEEGDTDDLEADDILVPFDFEKIALPLFDQTKFDLVDQNINWRFHVGRTYQTIINLFKTEKPYIIEALEERYITHSFPLLFGISDVARDRVTGMGHESGEWRLSGSLFLGKEVRTVFTQEESMPQMEEWLQKHQLKLGLFSIDSAYYLWLRQWMLHSSSSS